MANENQPPEGGQLEQHPLFDRLVSEGRVGQPATPPDVSVLTGFPAREPEPGFWRVYEDLTFQSYIRVAEADVVGTQTLATEEEPLRPSVIWVRQGADLQQTRVETRRVQAGFLRGELTGEFGVEAPATGRPVGPPTWVRCEPTWHPRCNTIFRCSLYEYCPAERVPSTRRCDVPETEPGICWWRAAERPPSTRYCDVPASVICGLRAAAARTALGCPTYGCPYPTEDCPTEGGCWTRPAWCQTRYRPCY
jgi:hypothetical protein